MNRCNEKDAEDTVIALQSQYSHCENDAGRQQFIFLISKNKC